MSTRISSVSVKHLPALCKPAAALRGSLYVAHRQALPYIRTSLGIHKHTRLHYVVMHASAQTTELKPYALPISTMNSWYRWQKERRGLLVTRGATLQEHKGSQQHQLQEMCSVRQAGVCNQQRVRNHHHHHKWVTTDKSGHGRHIQFTQGRTCYIKTRTGI